MGHVSISPTATHTVHDRVSGQEVTTTPAPLHAHIEVSVSSLSLGPHKKRVKRPAVHTVPADTAVVRPLR